MQQEPTTQPTENSADQPDASAQTRPLSARIGSVLYVLRTLIAHARFFAATVTTRIDRPEFAVAAAVFGTYNLTTIMFRLQRGIRRALALQRYLLARAARGGNVRFIYLPTADQYHLRMIKKPPRTKPAEPRPARRKEVSLLADDDPRAFYIPTDAELDAEVRRRPVGRTLTYICLDLGLIPGFCGGDMWGEVYSILRYCGGSIHQLYRVRGRREETFERERDRKPDTWHIEWRDFSDAAVRAALGCRIGETPPPIVPVPS